MTLKIPIGCLYYLNSNINLKHNLLFYFFIDQKKKMSIASESEFVIPNQSTVNLGVQLKEKDDLQLVEIPVPKPEKDHVQVQLKCVGICGSDIHLWKYGEIGIFPVTQPQLLGHEGAGIVTAVGENVTSLRVGDRVAIEA